MSLFPNNPTKTKDVWMKIKAKRYFYAHRDKPKNATARNICPSPMYCT